jgi:hypothetical protein
MSSAGFKPTIQASGRPLTLTLDRATTGTGGLSQLHCCAAKCLTFYDSVRWVGPPTLGRRSRYVHSKRRKLHTQRLCVTCQKRCSAVATAKPRMSHFRFEPTCNIQSEISSSF